MKNISDEIFNELAKNIREEIDREVIDSFLASLPKSLTIRGSGNILPKGYSKQELETMFSWLNDQAGTDGWAFTGRVFYIKDPKVKTMFLLRWA